MKLSIIIPCYNEEDGIGYLAEQLKPALKELRKRATVELLLVDDGSKDNTVREIKKHFGKEKGFRLLQHKTNKNLGEALKTGFAAARGDLIATMDSDCTYEPKLLLKMLDALDTNTDLVTASPYHPHGKVENVPGYRLALSKTISAIYRLLTGSKLHTFTALARLYRRKVIEDVKIESSGFLAVAELLIFSLQKGYRVKEVPTTLHVRKYGESKIRLMRTIRSHLGFIWRLLWRR